MALFGFFRNHRRRRIERRELTHQELEVLAENARFLGELSEPAQKHVLGRTKVFLEEKNWEGCGGLVLQLEHRLTIAAQMARMTIGMPREYFDETQSILVYPDAYVAKSQQHVGSGVVVEGNSGRLGEAWYRGPVILAWLDVLSTVQRENFARNVVVHEFAHVLDMRNSPHADGIPVIESAQFAQQWQEVMQREHQHLINRCRSGVPTLIDCYGATNLSEFFAVASEVYFEEPEELRAEHGELYELFDAFYHQRIAGHS